ncbi:MAG: PAS domain S-box protein [Promethearchaeota archaeon]|nr:MAG: PAS domain S-box protein [Candidatus Lokiarchaeota archaeon]
MKFLFISRDISERKKNELKLKESEKKYRNIIENVKDAIVITDFNGKYIYASPQTSMLIDGEKIKPKTSIFRNIHPEDLKKLTPLFQLAAKKRRVLKNQEKDFRIIKKDGSIRWISSSSKNYYNEEGEAIGFIVLLRDTTEKKETELKLMEKEKELRALNRKLKADFQQTAKELRESEEKFRTVADQSHLAILIYQNRKIQYCNQSLCTMTGLSYEQLYSYTLQDILKRINPKNHSKIKSRLNPPTLKKSTFTSNIQIQIQIPSGEKKWVEIHASTIKYQKKPANLVVLTDITEKKKNIEKLKESERTLKQKNIELQKLDELKNDFITISAHELKTPLVPVLGYLELILAQNNNLSDETIEHLEKVQNNAERLKVYIEQLIDVMKIDADKISLRREQCNAVDLLQKVISNLKVELERQNSEIFLDSEDKAILKVDPFRIGQIFSNLILNAIRFTQNGKIFISIQANSDHILFQIRDTGLGIAKKDLAHVFEKFMSIHKNPNRFSKAERGSGLGLYIAKGLVEAHNGKIWIESEGLNKGTTVSFTLPK